MPASDRRKLTDAAIGRLRPGEREYTVWDRSVPGLGVRMRPTGAKTYVLLEEIGGRTKRISLGPVSTLAVAEARRACHERRARPGMAGADIPARAVPQLRDFVEGEWKAA